MIKDIKNSEYVCNRQDEAFCRTVLDLVIADRLQHLEGKDSYRRLQVSAEIPVSIRIKDIYGDTELVKGRADWALGYGTERSDTGSILLVVEAKHYEQAPVGMPQLLVYMAAVHEARKDRNNRSVFGMVSDSKEYRFCFLNEQKKFFVTRPFIWAIEQSTIIAYIDMMLNNAIESSPHTTPHRRNNRSMLNYGDFLERQLKFGEETDDGSDGGGAESSDGGGAENSDGGGAEKSDGEDNNGMVDIVVRGDRVVMRGSRPPGR